VLRLVFQVAIVPRLATVAVAQQVRGGETLPVLASEGGLQVIEAPGHTLGQIIFYQPGRKLLFAGDAYNHQGGRIQPPAAIFNHDDAQAKRTLAELAHTLEVDASLPGHGGPIAGGGGPPVVVPVAARSASAYICGVVGLTKPLAVATSSPATVARNTTASDDNATFSPRSTDGPAMLPRC
jgi:glyoxylase-like metal-dependent hydrolase (beta-lactamase superfamily II)